MDIFCIVIVFFCIFGFRSEFCYIIDYVFIFVYKVINIVLRVCVGIVIGRDIIKVWG